MKITICEGEVKYTSGGDTLIHTFGGSANFNAGGENIWAAKNTFIGDYEKMELPERGNEVLPLRQPNIILNFLRADKEHLGNFVDKEFEENGWHIIDATGLQDALKNLTTYLGNIQADNIYINAHGLISERYILDENGEALRDPVTDVYKMMGDTGFYTSKDKILGSHLLQYISDKSKLLPDILSSIESFIGIANYVKSGKNLIMGSCWSVRYEDLFGTSISSIVKSRDIFVNRDYSSIYVVKDQGIIPFQNFINFNQTSRKHYIEGWVWYRDGAVSKRNFNIIMTKYGVKTI